MVQARKEEAVVAAAAGGSSEAGWNVIPQVTSSKDLGDDVEDHHDNLFRCVGVSTGGRGQ